MDKEQQYFSGYKAEKITAVKRPLNIFNQAFPITTCK